LKNRIRLSRQKNAEHGQHCQGLFIRQAGINPPSNILRMAEAGAGILKLPAAGGGESLIHREKTYMSALLPRVKARGRPRGEPRGMHTLSD